MKTSLKTLVLGLVTSVLLALTGCASIMGGGGMAPTKVMDGVLTDPAGMTLYTFDRDVAGSGKSVCNGPCAMNWPPLAATGDAMGTGDYSVITRDDGFKQWAYKGKPLHRWIKDQKPGDKTGDGVIGAWHVARPDSKPERKPAGGY